jgi:hypothetical protein
MVLRPPDFVGSASALTLIGDMAAIQGGAFGASVAGVHRLSSLVPLRFDLVRTAV